MKTMRIDSNEIRRQEAMKALQGVLYNEKFGISDEAWKQGRANAEKNNLIPTDRRNEDAQWKADFYSAMDEL